MLTKMLEKHVYALSGKPPPRLPPCTLLLLMTTRPAVFHAARVSLGPVGEVGEQLVGTARWGPSS